MIMLLTAVLVYALVFTTDYAFYVKQGAAYRYVSWQTWILITVGQITLLTLFFSTFLDFFSHLYNEILFLSLLTVVLFSFTYILVKEGLIVSHETSRTERSLTHWYVIVKGAEIVFQQMVYLLIALALVDLVGVFWYTYILYILILSIVHAPVIFGTNKEVSQRLSFGLAAIAAPCFYVFTEIGYFFPAVYLHCLMYVFFWLTFADFDQLEHIVHKRG